MVAILNLLGKDGKPRAIYMDRVVMRAHWRCGIGRGYKVCRQGWLNAHIAVRDDDGTTRQLCTRHKSISYGRTGTWELRTDIYQFMADNFTPTGYSTSVDAAGHSLCERCEGELFRLNWIRIEGPEAVRYGMVVKRIELYPCCDGAIGEEHSPWCLEDMSEIEALRIHGFHADADALERQPSE